MDIENSVELLQLARGGDDRALDALLRRYLPGLRSWAARRLPRWARDITDTDDLVQEVVLQTVGRVRQIQPRRKGALLAYLRQALLNRIRNELRRAHRRAPPVTLDSRAAVEGPSPLQELIDGEALERYEEALERLRTEDRAAIMARLELGQSWEELAAILGKRSAGAARMATSRAVQRLAKEMAREP